MDETTNINWFPGHMTRTNRKIKEILPLIDAVAEIVDARVPVSSRNPQLSELIADKPRIVLLNKSDMADEACTRDWIEFYKTQGIKAIAVDCKSGKGVGNFINGTKELLSDRLEHYRAKGMVGKPLRIMVVGIPNVGKSSFINRMSKGSKAKVEDRPGVTRGNQWFKIDNELELLDTPGVLWPKFEDHIVGEHLAFTGAVKDAVVDIEHLAVRLVSFLGKNYPEKLKQRYKISFDEQFDSYELLCIIGKKRGMLMRGGVVDSERAAIMLLDEFRDGLLGRITVESVSFMGEDNAEF
ncbi:MAG: ribosome biogenesis GTPase YlqF [bacterium]|nr:ribosome biogenesis GTPase YlqF [bacterium]